MNQHPLEVALAIQNKAKGANKEVRMALATDLGELQIFSNRTIGLILDLDYQSVKASTHKTDKTGGRFNPEALSLIYDLWSEYTQQGVRNKQLASTIVKLGISPDYLSKLTGIPATTIRRWVATP